MGSLRTVPWDEELHAGSTRIRGGAIYLVMERKPSLSYRLFEKATGLGLPGLCVTRQYPARLKENFDLHDAKFIWLSQAPGKDNHNPTNIGALATLISTFIEKQVKCVCLIDGLEYLVINNGFQQVLKFTELINEQVMQSESAVIVPISQNAFSDKELALIERNVETIDAALVHMPGEERDITDLIDKYRR